MLDSLLLCTNMTFDSRFCFLLDFKLTDIYFYVDHDSEQFTRRFNCQAIDSNDHNSLIISLMNYRVERKKRSFEEIAHVIRISKNKKKSNETNPRT